MKRILLIGSLKDSHINRFISGLRRESDNFIVDIFDISVVHQDVKQKELFDNIYFITKRFPSLLYKLPVISTILHIFDTKHAFKSVNNNYNIINIQYLTIHSYFLISQIRKIGGVLVLTPWGSDVYRIKKYYKRKFQKVYNIVNKVCAIPGTKFGDDIIEEFSVPIDKCVELCFGSNVLDRVIIDNTSRSLAKEKLFGSKDNFIITCGYNASISQNHIHIIDALEKVQDKLPDNVFLVFPMTYLKTDEYVNIVDSRLKSLNIKYVILRNFLSDDDMVYLRKCTDLFIHMQVSDAYSSSLHEYLYSGALVINAEWLSYKELEVDGLPYLSATFETLEDTILKALSINHIKVSSALKATLKKYTWSYQIKKWVEFYNQIH